MSPKLHLGNMTFAWKQASSFVDDAVATKMMKAFSDSGSRHFDTARIYAAGKSEEMTGRVLAATDSYSKFDIASKAAPSEPGGLSPEGIRNQLKQSMEALKVTKIPIYYLHQPDTQNDLTISLATVDELIKEGKIETFGLSNYSQGETELIVKICKDKGYPLPTVYQGLYNPINRRVETELFPTLRAHNISFVAYNPLAAGMLTGKHKKNQEVIPGRFQDNKNYLDRYYKDDTFNALEVIATECEKSGISMIQATYTWMMKHSSLGDNDGLLLGASSLSHLEGNIKNCMEAQPLSEGLLAAFDQAWEICRPDAFAFWRSYSQDFPNRENLDQGASYAATTTAKK